MSDKMVKCKVCGADFAKSAKSCPNCGAKNKKPFYMRIWFIALAIVVIYFGYFAVKQLPHDYDVEIYSLSESGSATLVDTVKASEIRDSAVKDPSTFLENSEKIFVVFTAQVKDIGYVTDDASLSGCYYYHFQYGLEIVSTELFDCEVVDTIKVMGTPYRVKGEGDSVEYIRFVGSQYE